MALSILQQGKTAIRDALKALTTHIVVSDDNDAFDINDAGINPAAGSTSTHVGAATKTDVDANTFDATIEINGDTQFTNKEIFAVGSAKGLGVRSAAGSGGQHTGGGTVGTDTLTRSVRALSIGVQAGDVFTLGVRKRVEDNS